MPDIITIFDASSSVAQKADTWAYALQDLADNYDPYFLQSCLRPDIKLVCYG